MHLNRTPLNPMRLLILATALCVAACGQPESGQKHDVFDSPRQQGRLAANVCATDIYKRNGNKRTENYVLQLRDECDCSVFVDPQAKLGCLNRLAVIASEQ